MCFVQSQCKALTLSKNNKKSVKNLHESCKNLSKMDKNGGLGMVLGVLGGDLGGTLAPRRPKDQKTSKKLVRCPPLAPPGWTTFGAHFRSISVPDRFLVVFLMSFFEYHFFIDFRWILGPKTDGF